MAKIRFTTKVSGVLADVSSVVLSDPLGVYGIKRNDTGDVVIAADTPMTEVSAGTYEYDFDEPADCVYYTCWVKWVYQSQTFFNEIVYHSPKTVVSVSHSPASVLASYLVDYLDLFTDPPDENDWPLFTSYMPDTPQNAAAVYDTAGVGERKEMEEGVVVGHHGIQVVVRSVDYQVGYAKIRSVVDTLSGVLNVSVSKEDCLYVIENVSVSSLASCSGVEVGERKMYMFSANLLMTFEES